ncbi:efflux RND transporter periplasmic adaptor subunit [Humisphaera borealis]|uniref:Efflux RND transporter periplasmic adaptor subunit n=1 Tax=Humisphaera borealis TaxID=2807512 RepID=A0A7M2WW55_9BACT|nr:efflux RND transporter periplasmic adaptor subunit [Humisphaera borealis]QOV89768.1 efflux RND transporter periplasmic adaptor subunit [Humisphaera borealis]
MVHLTPEAILQHKVVVEPATLRAIGESIRLPGRVVLNDDTTAQVTSPAAGKVVELTKGVGDIVSRGDRLAEIDSADYASGQADYIEKRTAFMSAESGLDLATKAAERASKLFSNGQGIAEGELQKRQAELAAAGGLVRSARASLTAARAKLAALGFEEAAIAALEQSAVIQNRLVLRAPADGCVIERAAVRGQMVGPDRDVIFLVSEVTKPWVLADLPQDKLAMIAKGTDARIESTEDGALLARGEVDRVSPTFDVASRSAVVRILLTRNTSEVASPDHESKTAPPATRPSGGPTSPASGPATDKDGTLPAESASNPPPLRPGMFVTIVLDVRSNSHEKHESVLAVPESAVQTIDDKTVVFIGEDKPGAYTLREVHLGQIAGGFYPVIKGLKKGERIVVSGTFVLKADLAKEDGGD